MDNQKNDQEKELTEKKEVLLNRRKKFQRLYYSCFALGIIFISTGIGQLGAHVLFRTGITLWPLEIETLEPLCFVMVVYGTVMFCAVAPLARARLRLIEEDIQDTEFEIDLLGLKATPEEKRAEKLLRMNQHQLRRYYNLNLSQNMWIFAVGILCIFLGVLIIALTVYVLVSPGSRASLELEEKMVLGILGGVGAILTDYVAAIYLKMHSALSESLTAFQSKLVSTNTQFLANLIASRIENDEKREDTLTKLALSMLEYKG